MLSNSRFGKLLLFVLVAGITFAACNNKKKSDKQVKTDDTLKVKPTAPGDLNATTVDSITNKPTAPGD